MNPLSLLGVVKGLNPWVILGVIAALSASHTYVYHLGGKHQKNANNTEKLVAVQRAIEQAQAIAKEDAAISEETAKTTTEIRWRTRDRIIEDRKHATAKPLPAECVLSDDRLRNINNALSGKPTDPGEPDYTLPPAAKIGGHEN